MKNEKRNKYGLTTREDLKLRKMISEACDKSIGSMDEGMLDSLKQMASGAKAVAKSAGQGIKNTANKAVQGVKDGYKNAKNTYNTAKAEAEKKQLQQKLDNVFKKNFDFFKKYKEVFGKEAPMIIVNSFRRAMAE